MSFLPRPKRDYTDGRTVQAFKDSTDINRLLAKHMREGTLSHLEKWQGQYGDYSDFDFMESQLALARGKQIFDELPGELKKEFNNDPGEFFAFVNDPENVDKLHKVLPGLAKPGIQRPRVNSGPRSGSAPAAPPAASGGASSPQASETPSSEGEPSPSD